MLRLRAFTSGWWDLFGVSVIQLGISFKMGGGVHLWEARSVAQKWQLPLNNSLAVHKLKES